MDKTLISADDFYNLREMAKQYEKSQKAYKKFEEQVALLRLRKKLQEDDVVEAEENLKKLKSFSLRSIGAKVALQYNQKLESAANAETETKRRLEECGRFLTSADDKYRFYLGDTQATLPSKEKYELLVEDLITDYTANSPENLNEVNMLRSEIAELSDKETFFQAIKDTIATAKKSVDTAGTYIDHLVNKKKEARDRALNALPAELLSGNFYSILTGGVVDVRNLSSEEIAKMKSNPKKTSKALVELGHQALDQLHSYLNAIGIEDIEIPMVRLYGDFKKMMNQVVDCLASGNANYDLAMRSRDLITNIRKSLEKVDYKLEIQSSVCEDSLLTAEKNFDKLIEKLQMNCAKNNEDRINAIKTEEARRNAAKNIIVRLGDENGEDENV